MSHDSMITQFEMQDAAEFLSITDAIHRFGAGQDLDDIELFRSAFTEDATLDFRQPAATFGRTFEVMPDRTTILGILETLKPLRTTHTVTNVRLAIDDERANVWCLVEAQHVDRNDATRFLRLKNMYDVEVVRAAPGWRISKMLITNVWHEGDPRVLFG